ncbi:MAG: heavy metal translocating P-type ATPase [Candidatus Faecivicinus sp.]|nr:heavy metal translocating P-type ATPase [Candidatus Faecivicinus sp.]
MTKKQKKMLFRILASAVLFVIALLIPAEGWLKLVIFLVPYLLVGYKVLIKAGKNILNGQVFDENFLMCVATIGAFVLGEYLEGVAVMLFYQVGELFEDYSVGRSRRSIADLMDIRPEVARVERDGNEVEVDPEEVQIGETIVLRPGDRVPLDGTVLSGRSSIDTAALTGESVPRTVREGDSIISGCINQSGVLKVRVDKAFGESTVSRILELVENSGDRKAQAEKFITRFARWYTPAVCISALLLAVIPSLITGNWSEWVGRALMFLVVSCPCALVISIPLSFFGGIGGASKQGILIKGGNFLEALANVDIVVFDKTGTLTKGTFKVVNVNAKEIAKDDLIELTALAESQSTHPISRSIQEHYGKELDHNRVCEVQEISGKGVSATVDGRAVAAGNASLMQSMGLTPDAVDHVGTVVHVAVDGKYAGYIVIADEIKGDAKQAISDLHKMGVRRTVMLTGDRKATGESVAKEIGLDEVHCELMPADKVSHVERLLGERRKNGTLAFVGDGINDAPVLARADLGIAMGALGSDAAIEAADIVLMNDKPSAIATAISISRKTHRIVNENIAFALIVKAAVLVLSALGKTTMWAAVFADVGVSVLAILNAMRALREVE